MSAVAAEPCRPDRPALRAGGQACSRAARFSLALGLLLVAASAGADPQYGGLILPGFDPILATTRDARLLGPDRLLVRQRLLDLGADPLKGAHPTLESALRAYLHREQRINLERRVTTIEIDGATGLETVFEYPEYFILFPASEPLPGGFVLYPPRPVDAPEVDLFLDELSLAAARRGEVANFGVRASLLDIRTAKGTRAGREGLLNLTIPIKLPRTLEKIIGRGEMTNIKVSGREHIAISGESTVSNKFVATERRAKPSLFPSLDMEQQLQINLAGTIGEKINIEVDHNSEVIGPEATKIRLAYRGTEDEIIQTIESGDVGLTLPGSQLLGYSSSKSGLFGIKVTGAVGRTDFTLVASKQKAESAAKSFNSRGGEVSEHAIECYNYLRNRFFRLDLPGRDDPGRGGYINPSSVQVYQFVPNAVYQAGDIENVAVYLDTTGVWPAALSWDAPADQGEQWWRPIEIDQLLDQNGGLVAIDLLRQVDDYAVLAVIYDVVGDLNSPGTSLLYEVGDDPGQDEANRVPIGTEGIRYLRMKLLKPQRYDQGTSYAWGYPLRNIYSLGGTNIDAESFELRIEYTSQAEDNPDQDVQGLKWIRIFGLDRTDPQRVGGPDDMVDKEDALLFDLQKGLLKFPLDFPMPFAGDQAQYEAYAGETFVWDESRLKGNAIPQIYDWNTNLSDYSKYGLFRLVAKHAAASGTINLKDSNIEEGSETVILDGQTLARGTDYDIDYTFGQVTLKGDAAARLSTDSQISVNYQYAPFMGGGNSSLLGLNLGFDMGRQSRISTTWLFETNQIAGHKAKLGEEPSRTLVGNLNAQHTFKPYFLTHVANFLSRKDTDKESSVQVNGEVAVSVPNPNTRGEVYLEDFEGIDASAVMPISRIGWMWGSTPAQGRDPAFAVATGDTRDFTPPDRVVTRWFLPKDNVLRRYLNPELREQEGKEPQQVLQVYLNGGATGWTDASWGGIMRGLGRIGIDLSKAQFLEFWVNDFRADPAQRRGTLHFDFGFLSEDFFWPKNEDGSLKVGSYEFEDRNRDGVFNDDEDIGLDGAEGGSGGADYYDATFDSYDNPFPRINGTERNVREDTEDLDGDTLHDLRDGYFSIAVDLADSALVDVLRDYPSDLVAGLADAGQVWRKFRIRLSDALTVSPTGGTAPRIDQITHVRVWYEDREAGAPAKTQLQFSEIKFLGSRWEREGIRKRLTEEVLTPAERGAGEVLSIGEVNNKENPDYYPPFAVHEENRIPEKEQSLVLDVTDLERDHVARVSKYISPRGDDYTQYTAISWYWFNPRADLSDLDLFFRVGADTLNYYEVNYRFDESSGSRTGWKQMRLDIAELSNAKFAPADSTYGWIATTVPDQITGQSYRVRVVGKPDLRRVKRYYFGVVNDRRDTPVSGYFYLNDVRLEAVKRENGFAERVALRLNMADVIKVDFDWSRRDADFHGLNSSRGQGYSNEDWNLTTGMRLDDFVPLLGFQVPLNLGRRQTIRRPKYLTNSDVELIDTDIRNAQSTVETRESYSVRVSHAPSRAALPRYLIDPWTFTLSGSHSSVGGPLERARQRNLQGALAYDLRIPGRYNLGRFLFMDEVPLLRSLEILPRKISFGGNFSSGQRDAETISLDGVITPRPTTSTRRGALNGAFEYQPLPIADVSLNVKSDRDLLRRRESLFGLNIGEELQYSQGLQIRFSPPKASGLPQHWLFAPLRAGSVALNSVRPQVTYNGQFAVNRDPSIRQGGDPQNVRSVSNSGDWDFRVSIPIDRFIRERFRESGAGTERERQRMLDRQRRLNRRGGGAAAGEPEEPGTGPSRDEAMSPTDRMGEEAPAAGSSTGGAAADTLQRGDQEQVTPLPGSSPTELEAEEDLTLEERQRREAEALLEQARQDAQRERDELTPARPDTVKGQAGPAWDQVGASGRGFHFPNPGRIVLGMFRSMSPIQASYSLHKASSYVRLRGDDTFWYRVGLASALDLPDSLYSISSLTDRRSKSLSTSFKLSRNLSADVKFNQSTSSRDQAGLFQENYQQDWPDLRLAITGVERWRVFGGVGGKGWFRSSNIDLGYKHSKTVSGATATLYNPRTTTTISPRWNLTFASGLSASLNTGLTTDRSVANGTISESKRFNIALQVRHTFRAERFLAKLNLYRPGSNPSIAMDFDVGYNRDTDLRRLPGSDTPTAQTGQTRLSANPRFSYQITRNLSGAVRFIFSRNKSIESNTVTKTFGLGLETTFVF